MIRQKSRTRAKFTISMSSLLLFVIGLGLAMTYFLNGPMVKMFLVLAAASLGIVIWSNREVPDWKFADGIVTSVAVLLTLILAYTAAAIWPSSGDEYGYLYLADTLLRGRFYNPAPPAPGLFDFFWIGMHDGKSVSQYPPGWPAFLAIFWRVLRRLGYAISRFEMTLNLPSGGKRESEPLCRRCWLRGMIRFWSSLPPLSSTASRSGDLTCCRMQPDLPSADCRSALPGSCITGKLPATLS